MLNQQQEWFVQARKEQGLNLGHLGCHQLLVLGRCPLVAVPIPLGFSCALGLQLHHQNPDWDHGKVQKETLSLGSDLRQEICMREVEFCDC